MAERSYKDLPTREQILEILEYDPDTGLFRWTETRRIRKRGAVAGHIDHGYVRIGIRGTDCFAHRLAYIVMTGERLGSEHEIDHINGVKTDNRWRNLRLVSRSVNVHNTVPGKLNTSGHRGVQWRPYNRKWIAQITVDGKRRHLGTFDEKADAVSARLAAEQQFGVTAHVLRGADGG